MTDHLLKEVDAAKYLAVPPNTLRDWRYRGVGPPFQKIGPGKNGAIRYDPKKLKQWSEDQTKQHTSE